MLIVSAPSGSGKSTIVQWLMNEHPELKLYFSISCTSRQPRGTERNGVDYFFISPEQFREKIDNDEFLEYEEVYENRFYGTLKAQVERQREEGQNVVFDVDVKGGINIKKYYGEEALSMKNVQNQLNEALQREDLLQQKYCNEIQNSIQLNKNLNDIINRKNQEIYELNAKQGKLENKNNFLNDNFNSLGNQSTKNGFTKSKF